MKILTSTFILFLFLGTNIFAQSPMPEGGGEYPIAPQQECLSAADYTRIQYDLQHNTDSLRQAGKLTNIYTESNITFDWPLRNAVSNGWNNSFAISNFIDHDITTTIQDYNCGARSYDGHRGIDIMLWPFPWYLVNNDLVEVVAAADGIIVQKYDGNTDENCSFIVGQNWNAVFVKHADGSVAWYGHMKKNSLTSKLIGQAVVKGEYLGIVASSGQSTGPHLHFEVRDSMNNVIDPYSGSCNNINPTSWWSSQPSYREPMINTVLTHDKKMEIGCPSLNEIPNFSNQFNIGDTIYTAVYYRDETLGDSTRMILRKPDNSIFQSWLFNSNTNYTSSYRYWSRILPSAGPFGTWTLEAVYRGNTSKHYFNYGTPVNITEKMDTQNGITISPNPMTETCIIDFKNSGEKISASLYNLIGMKQDVRFEEVGSITHNHSLKLFRSGQADGIYILVLENGKGQTEIRKIVLN